MVAGISYRRNLEVIAQLPITAWPPDVLIHEVMMERNPPENGLADDREGKPGEQGCVGGHTAGR